MGENLARNMERHGFRVSVYNRTAPGEEQVVERFIEHYGTGRRFTPTRSIAELAESVARPRKIMMMEMCIRDRNYKPRLFISYWVRMIQ